MKLFNFEVVLLIIFLTFCSAQEKKTTMNPSGVAEGDTVLAELKYDTKFLPDSSFHINTVNVVENGRFRIFNNTDTSVTFIIPNSNRLFKNNKKYQNYVSLSVNNVHYLIIPVNHRKKSKTFTISNKANPSDTEAEKYPYSAFCLDGTQAAEGNSSPIIIVDP